jgi:glycosyltransferase involved in cell wall biosynthesis
MFTCGVRDFKLLLPDIEIGVDSNFPAVWENNPYIDQTILESRDGVEFHKVGYPIINNANAANTHFTQGFLLDMIASAVRHEQLPIKLYEFVAAFANGRIGDPDINAPELEKYKNICQEFARQRPDVHLNAHEKNYNLIKEVYDVNRYWIIAPGGKRDCTTKIWDWRRFQDVIDHFGDALKFIVIGRSDHLVEKLRGVIDLTDKFNDNLRGLFPLTYHAEGVVSGVSLLMHLAAGMPPKKRRERKPCVAIYGGREPTTFTCYTNHQVLHTNGAFDCCDSGGCWQSRVTPLQKDRDKNTRMCHHTVVKGERTIQECMDTITAQDVIRGIEKYYEGNIYEPLKIEHKKEAPAVEKIEVQAKGGKEINILASLQSKGGGEQSALKIGDLLREAGWKVNFYPWGNVHEKWKGWELEDTPLVTVDKGKKRPDFKKLKDIAPQGVPLLFYANDQVWDFEEHAESLVKASGGIMIGINFANGRLPSCRWLSKNGKARAIVFQNEEKKKEFVRDQVGYRDTKLITMFGAIDLEKFLGVLPADRKNGKDELVVVKHCTPDWRKYITAESENAGEKIHIWQKHIFKERDAKFYKRLLDDIKNVRFEFMEAHSELINAFKDDDRMVFHKWDSMPVTDFLARGHIYLYRTSNKWRDQYPRTVAEALAVGLPVLTEPRDGTRDRVDNGNTGIHCIDYDMFLDALKKLKRKEPMRRAMGERAKDWARQNLDPKKWVEIVEDTFL